MGRGVSVPYFATVVTYLDVSDIEEDFEFQDVKENIIFTLKDKMPSLQVCERWLDREDLAILENELVYIGISTYGSVMSLWVVPKDQYLALAHLWIYRISKHVTKLGTLTKQGTMSNGVSVFEVKK